jgi:hypothetical protein
MDDLGHFLAHPSCASVHRSLLGVLQGPFTGDAGLLWHTGGLRGRSGRQGTSRAVGGALHAALACDLSCTHACTRVCPSVCVCVCVCVCARRDMHQAEQGEMARRPRTIQPLRRAQKDWEEKRWPASATLDTGLHTHQPLRPRQYRIPPGHTTQYHQHRKSRWADAA